MQKRIDAGETTDIIAEFSISKSPPKKDIFHSRLINIIKENNNYAISK